jgi:purine-nucleoside phosphorylase
LDVKNFGKKIYPNDYEFLSQVHRICSNNNIDMNERVVYCTDSIMCEYIHLDKIKALGSELIEMETASFYRCMELINKRGIA